MARTHIWAVLLAALLTAGAGAAAAEGPTIETVSGPVDIGVGDPPVWHAATANERLQPGSSIRVGPGAHAELRLTKGLVRLYENTLLRLPRDAFGAHGARAVEQDRGASIFDIDKDKNLDGFEVRTPEAVVMVKGTRFSVSLDGGAAAIAVFRGLVGVRSLVDSLEHEVLVRQGFTAVGSRARAFELRFERTPDPWPTWLRERIQPPAAPSAEPAAAEVERARRAALTAAKPEVLSRAMARDPRLQQKLRQRAAEHSTAQAALAQQVQGLTEPDSGTTDRQDMLEAAPPELRQEIEAQMTEELLNSGTSALALDIEYVTSGGPNEYLFLDQATGSLVAKMTESDVQQFLTTRDPTLIPAPVMTQITSSGVTATDFMTMMMDAHQ